jgi:tetratricopeptide (TPR) repeat protein
MLRLFTLILVLGAEVGARGAGLADEAAGWDRAGHSQFAQGDFKRAAGAFERALQREPDDARLRYWLGKSYARMAELSSPFSARRNAQSALRNLARAVQLEPRNRQYLGELFDFYLDSSEWCGGGLRKAEVLLSERILPVDPYAEPFLRERIAHARDEFSGAGWRLQQGVFWPVGGLGSLVRRRAGDSPRPAAGMEIGSAGGVQGDRLGAAETAEAGQ